MRMVRRLAGSEQQEQPGPVSALNFHLADGVGKPCYTGAVGSVS